MSVEIDLGEGKYAVLKEIDELRSGDTKRANSSYELRRDPETGQIIVPGDLDDNVWRALARSVITDWNLEPPIPAKRPESLDKLTLSQEDKLITALKPYVQAVLRHKEAEQEGDSELDPTALPSSTSG